VARYKTGGLIYTDPKELQAQKGVVSDLLKSLGSNIIHGKSVVNISLPVRIFEPRSYLQRIPDAWSFAPIFLTRAALADKNPLERFKLVITFVISGLHRATIQRKPFNPILGETFQATYADGTELFLEQISHHPPVSGHQVFGPDKIWHMHGYHEFKASFRPTGIQGGTYGPNVIFFKDGGKITWNMPTVFLSGIIMGDRHFQWCGDITFDDKANGLTCTIKFDPDEPKGFTGYFSSRTTPSDTIRGEIIEVQVKNHKEEKKTVSKVEGSWLDGISFEENKEKKQYWSKRQYKAFTPIAYPAAKALPSDCQFREDLIALKADDQQASQLWKTKLEEKQRYDSKLRKNALKSAKK